MVKGATILVASHLIQKEILKRHIPTKKLRNRVFKSKNKQTHWCFTYDLVSINTPKILKEVQDDIRWALTYPEDTEYATFNYSGDSKHTFSLDIETDGSRLLCYGTTTRGRGGDGGPRHSYSTVINGRLDVYNSVVIGHNIKYDIVFLKRKGYWNTNTYTPWDTMVANGLLNEETMDNSLKHLSARYTRLGHYGDDIDRRNLISYPVHKVHQYLANDCLASYHVKEVLEKKLKEQNLTKTFDFLMLVEKKLIEMETQGICLDKDLCVSERANAAAEAKQALIELMFNKPMNWNSPRQVSERLEELGFYSTFFTSTGGWSVSKESLKEAKELSSDIPSTVIDNYLKYRKYTKLISTYYDGLLDFSKEDGKIHTSYNLTRTNNEISNDDFGTATGRLSSNDPNLQNIPRGSSIRRLFKKADTAHYWFDADYRQLELRVAAFLSQEPVFLNAFENDEDPHSKVLAQITGKDYNYIIQVDQDKKHPDHQNIKELRVAIKKINFGILYGAGAKKIAKLVQDVGVSFTEKQCQDIIDEWFRKLPKLTQWIDKIKFQAREDKSVRSATGRLRRLPLAGEQGPAGWGQLRQAVNFPIQSLASDICLAALTRFRDSDLIPLLTVHDSIGGEVYNLTEQQAKDKIKRIMTVDTIKFMNSYFDINFNVKLDIDLSLGDRWNG